MQAKLSYGRLPLKKTQCFPQARLIVIENSIR
jgi:hypothetical protein